MVEMKRMQEKAQELRANTMNEKKWNTDEIRSLADGVMIQSRTENNDQIVPGNESQTLSIAKMDFQLIEELRAKLKAHLEAGGGKVEVEVEGGEESRYDSNHFEQIMNPTSPFLCWRYLLHAELDVDKAIEIAKSGLIYYKENGLNELSNANFPKEFWHQTPFLLTGQDKEQRDVVYVMGRYYRKPDAFLRLHVRNFVAHLLFGWEKKHLHDLNQLVFVFDVTNAGFRNIDLDFMTWLVSCIDYLPARIANIYVIGVPFILRPIVRLIISWLPERLSMNVHCGTFEQLVEPVIGPESIPVESYSGSNDRACRLAPLDAPWLIDCPPFNEPKVEKAIHDCIGFNHTSERIQQLIEVQIEEENKSETDRQQPSL